MEKNISGGGHFHLENCGGSTVEHHNYGKKSTAVFKTETNREKNLFKERSTGIRSTNRVFER